MPREMKDSGIEWIGEIPSHWQVGRTKNYYTNHKDVVGSKADSYERLALTLNGVIKRSKTDATGLQPEAFEGYQILRQNELVFKLIDLENVATSRVGYSPYTGIVSPAYIILNPRNEDESKFGEYFFLSMWQREVFNHMGDDGVRSSLNAKDLLNIPYPLVPSEEKQKIVAFLDTKCAEIDAVIEKTKATIEEYKALKQSVITEAVTKGIRGDRPMKDSGIEWIGEICENWAVIKATRIISSTQNGLTRRDLEKSDGNIVLKLKNITADGQISYEEINRISLSEKEIETYALNDGDFLFVRVNGSKNLVGKCAIYQALSETVAYNDHIIRVRLNLLCDKHYFHWYLMSNAGKTEIDLHTSTAAGQFTISGDGLRDLYIVLPSANEQKEIANYLEQKCAEIDTLIEKKTALLAEMQTYKKSLIFEYVTGKKEVG